VARGRVRIGPPIRDEHTDARGFVGVSSVERIPIERAVTEAVRAFKAERLRAPEGR